MVSDGPERERVLCVDRRDFGGFVVLGHAGEPLYNEHGHESGHTAKRPAIETPDASRPRLSVRHWDSNVGLDGEKATLLMNRCLMGALVWILNHRWAGSDSYHP